MNIREDAQSAAGAAAELSRAMEENDRAVRQFLSSASLVQSAYTMALGRVRQELQRRGIPQELWDRSWDS